MTETVFAAIDIGMYYVSMELFELKKKETMLSLGSVRQRLELGKDIFALKKITMKRVEELISILEGFRGIMREYRVSDYRICAKAAVREARNLVFVVEHVTRETGMEIEILSNSEQRFISYKSIASRGERFDNCIRKSTAIIDVGGGSTQLSLFEKDALVATQNIQLGSLRIRERLAGFEKETSRYDLLVEQMARKDISDFAHMYVKDRKVEHIILVGDYFTNLIFQNRGDADKIETREEFLEWYDHIVRLAPREVAEELGIVEDLSSVLIPMAVLYRTIIEELGAEKIWLPGIQLTDGIAYDYAERKKLIRPTHDFERDIRIEARRLAEKYGGNSAHIRQITKTADALFDVLKKGSMLDSRARLLLKVACALHECGRYISLVHVGECSYNIIRSTEIIGLTDRERYMIACIVRYSTSDFAFYEELVLDPQLGRREFVLVAALTAILRVAVSLDYSRMQKPEEIKITKKERKIIFRVETREDFTLEKGIFLENTEFFEEIYDLKPVLKIKKS